MPSYVLVDKSVDKYPGGWWIFFNNDSTTPDTKKGEIEKGIFAYLSIKN